MSTNYPTDLTDEQWATLEGSSGSSVVDILVIWHQKEQKSSSLFSLVTKATLLVENGVVMQ